MKTPKILLMICCVVLAITLVGCKSSASVIPPTTTDTTNEISDKTVIRDTVIQTVADSSYYYAYLECRDGKVVIKTPDQLAPGQKAEGSKKGNYVKKPNVTIKDNKLVVDCYAEVQYLKAQLKDNFRTIKKTITIKIPYPVKVGLTVFESFQIWCGRIFLFLLIAFIVAVILRIKKII